MYQCTQCDIQAILGASPHMMMTGAADADSAPKRGKKTLFTFFHWKNRKSPSDMRNYIKVDKILMGYCISYQQCNILGIEFCCKVIDRYEIAKFAESY